jgi:hypothetical protein
MFFRWEAGAAKRIVAEATFASVALGLFLAAFQVQGWTMPRAVAIVVIVLLALLSAAAISALVYEVVRSVRSYLEHRATTSSWVSSERPGLLDYEADFIRANERFTKELTKLNRGTQRLGARLQRHTETFARSQGASGKTKQRRANRAAKDIDKSAVFIEKRLDLFEVLVKDIARNAEGLIASSDLQNTDDIDAARLFRDTLEGGEEATAQTLPSVSEYRASVKETEDLNLSRTIRIASGRLVRSLQGVEKVLKKYRAEAQKLVHSLDRRIAEAERRHPKGGGKPGDLGRVRSVGNTES